MARPLLLCALLASPPPPCAALGGPAAHVVVAAPGYAQVRDGVVRRLLHSALLHCCSSVTCQLTGLPELISSSYTPAEPLAVAIAAAASATATGCSWSCDICSP